MYLPFFYQSENLTMPNDLIFQLFYKTDAK